MHEFSLYGQVPNSEHGRVRQQLAGVTRMQPLNVEEIHLIFKARIPTGRDRVQNTGGSQGIQQQDGQRLKTLLNGGLYYVQLVGHITETKPSSENPISSTGDSMMLDDAHPAKSNPKQVKWFLDFKDTPDAGKQVVSTRLSFEEPFEDGNVLQFLTTFGYDYVSRYLIRGAKFFDQNTTLFLHQVLQLPQVENVSKADDITFLSDGTIIKPFDGSGGYVLQASIDIIDSNNQELKDKATRQLMSLKEVLKPAVDLTPGDRLALDTRVQVAPRRI